MNVVICLCQTPIRLVYTNFPEMHFFPFLQRRCHTHAAIQLYIAITIVSMMTISAMRRSGVFVTAFATFSSNTTPKRGTTFATRAATTYSSNNHHYVKMTTASCKSTSFSPVMKNRLLHTIAQRRCQSSLASTLATETTASMKKSTSAELQAKMDITHPAFEVLQKDIVTEYGAYCTLYRHTKSGAELLSVAVDDDNKVFGITLRTPPEDSTGVPHILEHSVLCGSRKYTTKDPFVHLLKGSLQTFLNAFTYPDRTCYVVASQNEKDFYNLVNVYADAVYHPRAVSDPMVHAQEGWHLELDDDNKLIYNGVV